MSNIREVKFTKPDPQPNMALVAMLDDWANRARSGEIVACAVAGVKSTGSIATEWTGASGGWLHQLISGISFLQHRILRDNSP